MTEKEKETLLKEHVEEHESNLCDCDYENDSMCIGMLYLGGSQSKEDIFKNWY